MKIPKLKPNSAEFATAEKKTSVRECDMPNCTEHGEHRAPRSAHDLNQHFWFCMSHIKEYNKNWNYMSGMGETDIETQKYKDMTWDRPTWKPSVHPMSEDRLRKRTHEHFRTSNKADFSYGEKEQKKEKEKSKERQKKYRRHIPSPEFDALAIMGLVPPVDWDEIRHVYKKLAKKHHPDVSKNPEKSEELIKNINHAYSVLKKAYQNFDLIKDK